MEKQLAKQYDLMGAISTKDGVLSVGPARMILLSSKAYVFLVRSIYDQAPHALRFILYDVGYNTGLDFMSTLRGITEDKEELLAYVIETFKQAGYGNFDLVEFDLEKPFIKIHGTNLFETSLADEIGVHKGRRAVDHYSRGMFAGCFSQLLGMETVCEEMSCQNRGDEVCEFVIMPFTV